MAALKDVVDLGDKQVVVRELTINEIRQMFQDAKGDLSRLTFKDLLEGGGIADMARHFMPFTSLTPEDIGALAPSEIKKISAKIKEVNADFFEMLGGLEGALGLLAKQLESLTGAAPSSSNAATPISGIMDGPFSRPSAPSRQKSSESEKKPNGADGDSQAPNQ